MHRCDSRKLVRSYHDTKAFKHQIFAFFYLRILFSLVIRLIDILMELWKPACSIALVHQNASMSLFLLRVSMTWISCGRGLLWATLRPILLRQVLKRTYAFVFHFPLTQSSKFWWLETIIASLLNTTDSFHSPNEQVYYWNHLFPIK